MWSITACVNVQMGQWSLWFRLQVEIVIESYEIHCKNFIETWHTSQKNLLTFASDPIPDTDSGSLFHSYHCGIGDFRRFISISHTVTDRFSRYSAKWLMPTRRRIHNISGTIRQTSGSESGIIPDYVSLRLDALADVCTRWTQCSFCISLHLTLFCRILRWLIACLNRTEADVWHPIITRAGKEVGRRQLRFCYVITNFAAEASTSG